MNPEVEKSAIAIPYRTAGSGRTGPDASQILKSVFCAGVGVVSLVLALLFSWIAIRVHQGLPISNQTSDSAPPSSIGPAIVAVLCFVATLLMIRAAANCFARR